MFPYICTAAGSRDFHTDEPESEVGESRDPGIQMIGVDEDPLVVARDFPVMEITGTHDF